MYLHYLLTQFRETMNITVLTIKRNTNDFLLFKKIAEDPRRRKGDCIFSKSTTLNKQIICGTRTKDVMAFWLICQWYCLEFIYDRYYEHQ